METETEAEVVAVIMRMAGMAETVKGMVETVKGTAETVVNWEVGWIMGMDSEGMMF
jgi:hypothetical protein